MKICKKCGAWQSDEKSLCVDCGAKLGDSVSPEEEVKTARNLTEKVKKLERSGDELSCSIFERICGIGMLVMGAASGVLCLFPKLVGDGRGLLFTIFIIGIVLGFSALTPKLAWELEKLKYSLSVESSENVSPSGFWLAFRKIIVYGGAGLVLVMFAFAVYAVFRLYSI